MGVDDQKTLLKIRTFANDLLREKKKAGLTATEDEITAGKRVDLDVTKKTAAPAEKHLVKVVKKKSSDKKPEPATVSKEPPQTPITAPPIESPLSNERAAPEIKIPAFHELHNESHKDISLTAHSAPQFRYGEATSKNKHAFTSTTTIITDSRHVGDTFLVRLSKSFRAWLDSFKRSYKKRSTPTYAVEDVRRRKGVVQKATTKTGAIFTADNDTLREEIRRRQARQHDEVDISWSPNTEPGFALLESANELNTVPEKIVPENISSADTSDTSGWEFTSPTEPEIVEVPKAPIPTVTLTSQAIKENLELEAKLQAKRELPPVQIVEPVEPISPLDHVEVEKTETAPAIPEQPIVPAPPIEFVEPETNNRTEAFELIPTETYAPQINPIRAITNLIQGKSKFTDTNTNALAMGIAAVIAALVLVVVMAKILISLMLPSGVEPTLVNESNPIIEKVSVTQVPLTDISSGGLESLLQKGVSTPDNFSEIEITDIDKKPLSPNVIFDLLGFSINPNFKQAVSNVHLVVIDGNKRGIAFKINDQVTAFGALLAWESNMSSELKTLMNLPDLPSETKFTDGTLFETDIRVLKRDDTEVIVYGFVANDIVLIVPDTTSFQRALIEQF